MRWSREGILPNLARLWKESVWTTPEALPGLGNDAVWTSVYTGVNPGRHGRYYYLQFQPDTYEMEFRDDDSFSHRPFWQSLSEAGLRVAIIDFVHAPLTPFINGIQVADWMAHGRYGQPRSWPPGFIKEIVSRYGEDPFQGSIDKTLLKSSTKTVTDWRDLLVDRVRRKTALSREIFEREPWDLFMTVYGEAHDIGHGFWHLHDASHPNHDAKWVRRHGDPVKDVYVEIDRAIGEWAKLAENQGHLVIFAAPGMGPDYTANGALDELLSRIERLVDGKSSGPDLLYRLRQIYRKVTPNNLRRRVSFRRKKGQRPSLSHHKFFAVPHNENSGAIRFNVKGRDRFGVVEPGPELAALRQRISEELCRIINKESGKPLVEKIVHTNQEYHGLQTQMLPDLLVIWNRDAPIRRLISPVLGTIDVSPSTARTGDHTPNALLMVHAASAGRIPGTSRLEDIAPTIADLLGVNLPHIDGRALRWTDAADIEHKPG
jgi:predicted AlkP superfamily phosphohydrolase/phosphomutase